MFGIESSIIRSIFWPGSSKFEVYDANLYVFDLNELEAATATLQADSGFGIASDYGWGLLDRGDDTCQAFAAFSL